MSSTSQIPCKFFRDIGNCWFGAKCQFSHIFECRNCGEKGHVAKNCQKKIPIQDQKEPPKWFKDWLETDAGREYVGKPPKWFETWLSSDIGKKIALTVKSEEAKRAVGAPKWFVKWLTTEGAKNEKGAKPKTEGLDPNNKYSILSNYADVEEVFLKTKSEHFYIPITLKGKRRQAEVKALVDCGASTLFISRKFVKKHDVQCRKLLRPIPVKNIDGSLNAAGSMTHFAELGLKIGNHEEEKA
ncbi:hypothetical protein C8R48DRAFT_600850, partial [Suillus tomentosus]